MNQISRWTSVAVIAIALVGCGESKDTVKQVPTVTPDQKAELQKQHEAGSTGSSAPAGDTTK